MDYSGKKILILGGGSVHNKVVEAAKEMGIYTIVADYYEEDKAPAKKIADESIMLSVTDVDGIVDWCRNNQVNGIVNCCNDPAQKPYQQICSRLGLPCYGNKEQFDILTNKIQFKKYCIEHGVDVIPEYTKEDIMSGNVQYPIFIKPSNSRGSRGQKICYSYEEALGAIKEAEKESSEGKMICEKYMENCQDIASAYFVIDGIPYLVKFGDRILGDKEYNLDRQVICTRLPSVYSNKFEEKSINKVKKMITNLGVKFGPVFLQGFIDGDTIRYYDPGMRMPGGDYDRILKKATGFDTVKSLIHFSITGDSSFSFGNPKECFKLDGGLAFLLCITVRSGVISRMVGMDILLSDPRVVYYRQNANVGDFIPNSGDVRQRIAAIGALVPSDENPRKFLEHIYNTYHVYDELGDDMIVSRVDTNSI